LERVELVVNVILGNALEELNHMGVLEFRQNVSLIEPKLVVNFSCIPTCFRHVSLLKRNLIGMTELPQYFLKTVLVNVDDGWLVYQFRVCSSLFEA
jgi:hypothetical protein